MKTYEEAARRVRHPIDSNNDDELFSAEFEIGLNMLQSFRNQNYPGMKKPEVVKDDSEENSEPSISFSCLDADEDGVLSPTEFSTVIERFL